MGKKPDFYEMLGLFRNATQEEIRKAYLKAVQRLHPDKNTNPGETELFLEVQQAYEVLGDAKRREKYDAILPPEPEKPVLPFKENIIFSRSSLGRMSEPQLIYALIEISANQDDGKNLAPPLNLCLVLDTSTSMKGEKLDVVKETAFELIQKLRPQDALSIITFSDRANVLIPATRGLELRHARSRIQSILPSGGTEIFQGLNAGMGETRKFLTANAVNHIILLTDGQTYGDEQHCFSLAETAASEGVGISGLGIGSGWNDIFLDALSGKTGGSCMFVSDPKHIQRFIMEKYERLAKTFAEDVTLDFTAGPGVELSYVFRLQPEADPLLLSSPIKMGPIEREKSLQTLLEFRVLPEAVKTYNELLLLDGKLNVNIPSSLYPLPPSSVRLLRPIRDVMETEPPPVPIVQALSRLTMYRMQEKARKEAADGQYENAAGRLQRMATHLLAQGERSLAKTVLLEAENLQKQRGFSEGAEKQIKFGTRALLISGRGQE